MDYKKAMDIIKEFEGCELKAYLDGGGVWTIGYGSTGPDIIEGLVWTQEQAEEGLVNYFNEMVEDIRDAVKFPDLLSENMLCAICSLVYNIGIGNSKKGFRSS